VQDWFNQLSRREQTYVLVAGIAVVLYVLYMGMLRPLEERRDSLSQQNQGVAASLANVQAMANELKQLRSGGAVARKRNLNQLINTSTARHKIRPSRMQPNARGDVQVRFEDVDFAAVLRWLHQLEYVENVQIREVSINQGDRSGAVNASVRIGQDG
jgi:general secretion pathway protein M